MIRLKLLFSIAEKADSFVLFAFLKNITLSLMMEHFMSTFGAFTVISSSIHANKILLIKRRDFPLWDLPGGRVESDESPEHAAVREAWEESGFEIEIERFTGTYHNTELDDFQFIYQGKIVGGSSLESGDETAAIDFFPVDKLPLLMVPHRKMQIKKALTDSSKPLIVEIRDSFLVRYFKKK